MTVYTEPNESLPQNCVLALGNFDGVHIGHAKLLAEARRASQERALPFGIYTFSQNTKTVITGKKAELLTEHAEREAEFEASGTDFVCYEDFLRVRELSPSEFCRYLADAFHPDTLVCGENYTFGANAGGNAGLLAELMAQYGTRTVIVPTAVYEGRAVSSSYIRTLIKSGDMEKTAAFLGKPYSFTATVCHGEALARELGYPTVNQAPYGNKLLPPFGVYVCRVCFDGKNLPGVANIGVKPTVTHKESSPPVWVETHVIGYDGDLYGTNVTLLLCKRIRPEIRFVSADALAERIREDVLYTKKYFEETI